MELFFCSASARGWVLGVPMASCTVVKLVSCAMEDDICWSISMLFIYCRNSERNAFCRAMPWQRGPKRWVSDGVLDASLQSPRICSSCMESLFIRKVVNGLMAQDGRFSWNVRLK